MRIAQIGLLALAGCGRIGFDNVASVAGDAASDAAGDAASDVNTTANVVFVTSIEPSPGALGGLAGADATCEQLAADGGRYVAWLSTASVNARDRLGAARGWVRRDGRPFADTVGDIVAGRVWYPPMIQEDGTVFVSGNPFTVTGTSPDGTASGGTCGDWTDLGGVAIFGFPFGGTDEWSHLFGNTTPCGAPAHFYCFGVDRKTPLEIPVPVTRRRVFITRGTFDPATGVGGADALCNAEALAASLGGSYLAMIATTTATPSSRFSLGGAPWYRVDDVEVTADLVTILAPINITADGSFVDGAPTLPSTGAADPFTLGTLASTCQNWTSGSAADSVFCGSGDRVRDWFASASFPCNSGVARGVYCFAE